VIRRLLIANRGEIAVRVLRTCQRLGIHTTLAATEVDLDSTAARRADRVVPLPGGPRAYLDVPAVMAAARAAGADALHPGYGFLSENPRLARACAEAGITFVGPTAETLAAVGDKPRARERAAAAGLPVLPGGEATDAGDAVDRAERIGWPLLVKAAGGGGGRGIHVVEHPGELAAALDRAAAEARAAFGESRVYLERYVESGRHVEVQLLGDGERVVPLGDRDCSVQRRYQKLIEEAPAPGLDPALRARMHAAAVAFGATLGYRGAGTVEFLVDGGAFYFLEMNARIQVEHPVTEAVLGVDLVEEQIAVADSRPLWTPSAGVTGHAIECRINAEDASFRPSPGTVTEAWFPAGPGLRVDTHVEAGTVVPPFYDSLLAKVVAHGPDRPSALRRLAAAVARCAVAGVDTNVALHAELLAHPDFRAGGVSTTWRPDRLVAHG